MVSKRPPQGTAAELCPGRSLDIMAIQRKASPSHHRLNAGNRWGEAYRLGISLPDRDRFCFCPSGTVRRRLAGCPLAYGRPAGRRVNVICAVHHSSARIGLRHCGVANTSPVAGSLAKRAHTSGLGIRALYRGTGYQSVGLAGQRWSLGTHSRIEGAEFLQAVGPHTLHQPGTLDADRGRADPANTGNIIQRMAA